MMWLWCYCLLVVIASVLGTEELQQPHIVFIVADDLGWDDVSFHGSDQILTPNIDLLAYQGVILNQYYTDCGGSASRSALLTGKYPMRLGMQGASIKQSEDRGIPIKEILLPELLRNLGYKTHLVGKWGVGKSRAHYLPTRRGFDTFYGFLGDSVDYLTYNAVEQLNETTLCGLDFFDGLESVTNKSGYLTDVLTERAVEVIRSHKKTSPLYLYLSHAAPHAGGALVNLQPPSDFIKANGHIVHSARRLYAAVVASLDASIGHVVAALAERQMLENTIIIFVSDNGAPTVGPSQNFGSNLPLRGLKGSPWEGGVRSLGIIWRAPMIPKTYDHIFHVTDWFPTLLTAAGGRLNTDIDGVDQWVALHTDETPPRNEVLITIDDLNGFAAFRDQDFKVVIGDVNLELGKYYGKDLKQDKKKSKPDQPKYEDILLSSETSHVFTEILELFLDLNIAFTERANLNITSQSLQNSSAGCVPSKKKGCLYNISADPLETKDLWDTKPDIVKHMILRLRTLWTDLKPRRQPQSDIKANPSLRNYLWNPWIQNNQSYPEPLILPSFPMQATTEEVQHLIDLNFDVLRETLGAYIGGMRDSIYNSVSKLFIY